jgi:hypothetical protein
LAGIATLDSFSPSPLQIIDERKDGQNEQKEDQVAAQAHRSAVPQIPSHHGRRASSSMRADLSRTALPTTLTDDNAIAAAAITGESSRPRLG